MKKIIILLILVCTLPINPMRRPMPQRPSQTAVINDSMRRKLDTFIPEIIDRMFNQRNYRMLGLHQIGLVPRAIEIEAIPNHMIKTEEQPGSRLQGAQQLENSIYTRNLHLLELPPQEPYQIPNALKKSLSYPIPQQLIIAQKIPGAHDKPINLEQVMQLIILLQDTYYLDCHSQNLVHTNRNTLGLIDTELRGFQFPGQQNFAYCLQVLIDHNIFELDAQAYIQQELLKVKMNNKFKPNA